MLWCKKTYLYYKKDLEILFEKIMQYFHFQEIKKYFFIKFIIYALKYLWTNVLNIYFKVQNIINNKFIDFYNNYFKNYIEVYIFFLQIHTYLVNFYNIFSWLKTKIQQFPFYFFADLKFSINFFSIFHLPSSHTQNLPNRTYP